MAESSSKLISKLVLGFTSLLPLLLHTLVTRRSLYICMSSGVAVQQKTEPSGNRFPGTNPFELSIYFVKFNVHSYVASNVIVS